jgi:photosystem II stability/assembly factor-like uncharacterized protein
MKLTLLLLLLTCSVYAQKVTVELIAPKVNSSFRGVSVVNDNVAWVSGNNGWIGLSTNGGKKWDFHQVKNYEKTDFRSVYAFSSTLAVIANAGSPASVLVTSDGGISWKEVYRNESKEAFFDGIDFWNEVDGVIYGDPTQGKLTLMRTTNRGNTWHEVNATERPAVAEGEASFAASGTGIRCYNGNRIVIATGGLASHLLISKDKGRNWKMINTPILQGKNSTGIFSVAFANEQRGVIVGGDYLIDSLSLNHIFYTHDGGLHWQAPETPTRGYRECVEYLTDNALVSTGPSGVDVSYDGGLHWEALSNEKGFHVVRKAREGTLMIMAGMKGQIGLIK